jgi:Arabinose efflux permease
LEININYNSKQNTKEKKGYLALIALAISAFAIGTTEFVIVGLLPSIAENLNISITSTGLLVSGYALGVAFGAPILTSLTSRISRKSLLLILMIIFIIGNITACLSESFTLLLIARVISAFAHGVFFSIASTIASELVSEDKKASAIALVFTGLTVATITGVPLGTYIGQQFGWRSTFFSVFILGIIAFIATLLLVPKDLKASSSVSLKDQVKLITNKRLILAFLITALGYGGTFVTFTFLSPILEKITGYSASSVTLILLLYGVAIAIGNTLGGKAANKNPLKALLWMFAIQAIVLLVLSFTAPFKVAGTITVLVMGLFAFMNVPGLQSYVVQLANKYVPSAVDVASAINISAFNLGIALGSFIGGIVVNTLGLLATPWIGALLVLTAVFLTIISIKLESK